MANLRQKLPALIAAAALTLAACSSTTSGQPSSVGDLGSTNPSQSLPDLSRRVLTLADLGIGWAVDNSTGGNDPVSGCFSPAATISSALEGKEVQFKDNGALPSLLETVAHFGSAPVRSFAAYVAVFSSCKHLTVTDSGHSITINFGRMSFPKVGNQSAAFQGSSSYQGFAFALDFVIARVGNYIALIGYFDLGTPDVSALESLTTKAIAKLR